MAPIQKLESKMKEAPIGTFLHHLIVRQHTSVSRSARHLIEAAEQYYHSPVRAQKKEALIKELSQILPKRDETQIKEFLSRHFSHGK